MLDRSHTQKDGNISLSEDECEQSVKLVIHILHLLEYIVCKA